MLHLEAVGLRENGKETVCLSTRADHAGMSHHDLGDSAANERAREVHSLCRRLFGSSRGQASTVASATRSLLASSANGTPIALRGESDLVPIARALHDRLIGAQRAFVVCDPRRRENSGSVRCPPNRRSGADAARLAVGGSVCLRASRLPRDLDAIASAQARARIAQIFVCLYQNDPLVDVLCSPIVIPSLASRSADLERVVEEHIAEATRALGVEEMRLCPGSRQSFLWHIESLAELEKSVLRLVALKAAPSMSRAAASLDIAPVSLARWAGRRDVATALNEIERCSGSSRTDSDSAFTKDVPQSRVATNT